MIPPYIDPVHVRGFTDYGSFERGSAYQASGAVQQLTWDPVTSVIEAVVAGGGGKDYRCRVRLDPQRTFDNPYLRRVLG